MPSSNDNGRALEFAYLIELAQKLIEYRDVKIEETGGYNAAKRAWESATDDNKTVFSFSAQAGIKAVLDCEPLLADPIGNKIQLKIPTDVRGQEADVRDIIILCSNTEWEIGISVKNNHSAVKHPRLSGILDFGDKWFGIPCSEQYWEKINPVFEDLKDKKNQKLKWNEVIQKEETVYVPLLEAFLSEIQNSYQIYGQKQAKNMVEYLIGKKDFYKAIGRNRKRITEVQPYNLRGTLNKSDGRAEPKIVVPTATLPNRIIHADFVPESNTTVEIIFDEGWHMTFRLHNASSKVEASLKFDVQFKGMPANIISLEYRWD